jgi:hypothetical protein
MKPTISTLSGVQDVETLTRFREENSADLADALLAGDRSALDASLNIEESLAKQIKAISGTSLDESIVKLVPALRKLRSE